MTFPKDEFAQGVDAAKENFSTTGIMLENPEIAAHMARHSVRAQIAKDAPVRSYDEFCATEGALILANHGLDATDAELNA